MHHLLLVKIKLNINKHMNFGMSIVLIEVSQSRRLPMEKLMKMVEDVMVAITFAEAGEFDEANRIIGNEMAQEEKITAPATGR